MACTGASSRVGVFALVSAALRGMLAGCCALFGLLAARARFNGTTGSSWPLTPDDVCWSGLRIVLL